MLSFNRAITFSLLLSYPEFIFLGDQRVSPTLLMATPRMNASIFPFLQQAAVKIISSETSYFSPLSFLANSISQYLSHRFNLSLGRWDGNWQVHPLGTKLSLHKVRAERRRGKIHTWLEFGAIEETELTLPPFRISLEGLGWRLSLILPSWALTS